MCHRNPENLLTWSRVSKERRGLGGERGIGLVRDFYRAIFPTNDEIIYLFVFSRAASCSIWRFPG